MKTKVHTYDTDDRITVTWDQHRCIHAKVCVHNLPRAFDPDRRPWIEPGAAAPDALAAVIEGCPTGALHYERHDGGAEEEPPPANTVRVVPDGPLYVHGQAVLLGAGGETLLEDARLALCRCGLSGNKPLCDGSHLEGFADAGVLRDASPLSEDGEATPTLRVTALEDGPLLLEGAVTVRGAVGETAEGTHAALCRCGLSGNKPFCDGSHSRLQDEGRRAKDGG